MVQAHHLQETRLQATIAQQTKLIDYLQTVSTPPRLKLKKVCPTSNSERECGILQDDACAVLNALLIAPYCHNRDSSLLGSPEIQPRR